MKKNYIIIKIFIVFFWLTINHTVSAQFYRKHYIAPTTWNYFTEGNEFVIATQSSTAVTVNITKSDGTFLQTVTAVKGNPATYRPTGTINTPRLAFNTVLNNAGVIITGDKAISVEQRNIVGLRSGGGSSTVVGNALLISFGNAGLGKSFRVGYYRDDSTLSGSETPTYIVMSVNNNTRVSVNGTLLTTLNAGQSYLFKAPIGSLVTSSDYVVMNVSAIVDSPESCGDGTADQVPPLSSLGNRYMMVRGKGNKTAEQIIVIATDPNTILTLKHYNLDGSLANTETRTLVQAGNFTKFNAGGSQTAAVGTVTEITSTSNVTVYAGTGDGCEVDVVTGVPISPCSGSFDVGSTKFMVYTTSGTQRNPVPYFGYLYLTSSTDIVTLNGVNLENLAGARRQLGTSGIYLIDFDNTAIGSPDLFDISCNSKFNMELVQSGSGYGMASFFSGIADLPETPSLIYNAASNCVNTTATLTGDTGYAFYQWFLDDVEIPGAISNIHTATRTGTYEMGAFLPCGQLVKSLPVDVVLCADVSVAIAVDNNIPDMGSNIVFTVTAANIGNNSKSVTVTDLLPNGFTFVSAVAPRVTAYNSTTGLWDIGRMEDGESLDLKITATVRNTGTYTNSAIITSSAQPDPTPGNNNASITIVPQAVTVGCAPVPTAVPVVQPTCGQLGTIEITNPLGSQYEYKLNNGPYQASALFTNVNSGTYTVTVRLAATPNCVSTPATVIINAIAGLPAQPTVTRIQPTCTVPTGTITVTGPTGAVDYSIDGINYQASNVFTGVATGNYNVTARNTNDIICISAPTNAIINVAPLNPSIPITAAMSNVGCNVFTANWSAASNTSNYFIDVSTNSSFTSFVSIYNNFNVGNVIAYPVSGLITGTTYYYRVRSSNGTCTSVSSQVVTAATSPVTPGSPIASAATNVSCSTINANWGVTTNAFAYFLDVSTLNTFTTFVDGYNSLDVGNVTTFPVTGLAPGITYYYRVRALNGCGTSSSSASIAVTTATIPSAPTVAAITQPTCTALGTVTLSGLPSGNWILNLVGGTGPGILGSTPTVVISDIAAGSYSAVVTNTAGCTSAGSATIIINTQPPTPTAPFVGVITHPTCALSTGSVELTGLPQGDWIINPGAFSGIGNSRIITGLAAGTHNFTVTNSSGCVSSLSAAAVINVQPVTPTAPMVGSITAPTCTEGGTVILSGLPSGNWVLHQSGASNAIFPDTGASITLENLLPGTYTYTVVNDQGCRSGVSANVVIPEIPVLPNQPTLGAVVHPTCTVSTGSVTLNNLPPGDWILSQTGPVSDVIMSSGLSYTASGLTAGDYHFELNSAVFCTTNNGNITINAQPALPQDPIFTVIQPTCTDAGRVDLSGLPPGDWTLNLSGTATRTIQGSGSTYSFTDLTIAGTYSLSVTNEQGCASAGVSGIVITAQPVPPVIPVVDRVTQPTCMALGIIELSGLPTGNWILRSAGATGSGIFGSGPRAVIEDLPAGTYNVTVADYGGCVSDATNAIEIFTQPPTPIAPIIGTITQPSCTSATGRVELTGLPLGGDWIINPGEIPGTGNRVILSDLTAGTYNFTVTNDSGCISTASGTVVINAQPPIPSMPIVGAITQPTCTSDGTVELTGLPSGNWILNVNGAGTASIEGSGTSYLVEGLLDGSYNFTVNNDIGCTSPATNNITINIRPQTPAVPNITAVTQPSCTALGIVELSGLPAGNWIVNLVGGTVREILGSTPSIVISDIAAGIYNVTVTNAAGCTSAGSGAIVINAQHITPQPPVIADIIQPTCALSTGSIELTGLPLGNWIINPGVISGIGNSHIITGLAAGTHNFTVTNSSGCVSPFSIAAVITVQPVTPTAPMVGSITAPTCTEGGTVILSGLPSGNWVLHQSGASNAIFPDTGASITLENLLPGTYTYTVVNDQGCRSGVSANVIIPEIPVLPNQPTLGAVVHPTCAVATGSITLNNLPSGSWTITQTGPIDAVYNDTGSSFTITGLISGSYHFELNSAVFCTTNNGDLTINPQPVTPQTPMASIIQPTCTDTGSVELSGLPPGDWTLNLSGTTSGTIYGSGSTYSFTDLSVPGTYAVSVTNDQGCTSALIGNLVINTQPVTPAVPTVATITQPTCMALGIVSLSGLPSGSWTLNLVGGTGPGISGSGPDRTITDVPAGIYNVTVTNDLGCVSNATNDIEIFTQPPTPVAPIIGTITQPTCASSTGSVELTGLPLGQWIINPGEIPGTGNRVVMSALTAGTYNFTVTNDSGCISPASGNVVINTQPVIPSMPNVGTITQPTCTSDGTVQLTGLPAGNWVLNINGTRKAFIPGSGTSYLVEGLIGGLYSFTVTNDIGCTSAATSSITVDMRPQTPAVPTVTAVTQPTCTALGTVTLSGLPSGNWILNLVGGTVPEISGSTPAIVISDIAAGIYNAVVTNAAGCTSAGSATIIINTQPPTPTAPFVGVITHPTCALSTGSVELAGLPQGDWIINPGAFSGIGNSRIITGLAAGTHNFTVTNSSGCVSSLSAAAVINVQPVTPTAPMVGSITAPTCTEGGTVILSGLPSGNWVLHQSGASNAIFPDTGASITLENMLPGTYIYTVVNDQGCRSGVSANVVIPEIPILPNQPTLGAVVHPTCTVSTGSVTLNNLPPGDWILSQTGPVSDVIMSSGSSYTASGLTAGDYHFELNSAVFCTTNNGNVTINAQPLTPQDPIFTVIQPSCTDAGRVDLSGLPSGDWTLNLSGTNSGAIRGSGSTYSFTNLSVPGTYAVSVTNDQGCTSAVTGNLVINGQPVTPAIPVVDRVTQPTCMALGIIELSGLPSGNWILRSAGATGSGIFGSGPRAVIEDLPAGTYNVTVANYQGCVSDATNAIEIFTQPPTPIAPIIGTIIQPSCTSAMGSIELTGLPLGSWIINPGAVSGAGTQTVIKGLTTGVYSFTVTNDSGCISPVTGNVNINAQPPIPSAPIMGAITQPTCTSDGTVELTGLPSGNWILNVNGAGTVISGSGTSYLVEGLLGGSYNFTVNNDIGCTSPATNNITINIRPQTPAVPNITAVTQPSCTALGIVELSGLPAGNWIVNLVGGTVREILGSTPSIVISDIAAGIYSVTVTNAAGCTSAGSGAIVINAQHITPQPPVIADIIQPTCALSTGSIELTGLPLGNWIINPGVISGIGNSHIITGLAAGAHNFTVTNSSGCVSPLSIAAVITVQPVTPTAPMVGSITAPTCTEGGTVILSGLPSGNWVLHQTGVSNAVFSDTGASITLENMLPGTYTYTVVNDQGCRSGVSANVIIPEIPVLPNQPTLGAVVHPTCAVATGSITLNNLPSGSWTITQTGPIDAVYNDTGSSFTITGLISGSYHFELNSIVFCTANNGDVTINAQPVTPQTPMASIIQPTCTDTGSVELSGLPPGDWTLNLSGTTSGTIYGSGSTYSFTDLSVPGTYAVSVTNDQGCTSALTGNLVINAQPVTPAVPTVATITQPTCMALGIVSLSGLPSGSWTLNLVGGTGPGISGSGPDRTITDVPAGIYNVTVTNDLGCVSNATNDIEIFTQPPTPSAPIIGTITQPTCSSDTGSVALSGLPVGSWTINPGAVSGAGTQTVITGLMAGNAYNFTVTNGVGCQSTASGTVNINTQPLTPSAPIVGTVTQPTCVLATASIVLSGLPSGNWVINPGALSGSGPNRTITGLTAGGTYDFTVTNDAGCVSPGTGNININSQPLTPAAPIVGTVTHPTCVLTTGSVLLRGLPTGNWVINPGAVSGTGSEKTITGLTPGSNYQFTVTNAVGCSSSPTANVPIAIQPSIPLAPMVELITQPTCTLPTGSVKLNNLPIGNWEINPGGILGTGNSFTISGLATGIHNFTVTNASGCVSPLSADAVINAQPVTPDIPIIGTITDPTCLLATGSVVLRGLPTGNWTINPGAVSGSGTETTVTGLISGTTYVFTVTNAAGCTSLASANVKIKIQPVTPLVPIVGTVTDPTCDIATGSVILKGLPSGNWVINPGAVSGTGLQTTITGLAAGRTYNFTVTNSSGCVSAPSGNVVVKIQPVAPTAPTLGLITQPTCANNMWSVELTDLPAGNWVIKSGSHEVSGSGLSTTIYDTATGTYNFTVTNEAGCTSAPTAAVVIDEKLTPGIPIVSVVDNCDGTSVLSTTAVGSLLWSTNETTSAITVNTAGIYTVIATNSSGCVSSQGSGAAAPKTTPEAPVVTVDKTTITIKAVDNVTYSVDGGDYSGNLLYRDLAAGSHTVTAKNQTDCISPVTGIEIAEIPDELIIYNSVSPNGDGKNDYFNIKGLDYFPDNSVEIFNRYGISVFKEEHYDNKNIVFRGENLATGTYFYIIEYVDKNFTTHTLSGYLFVN